MDSELLSIKHLARPYMKHDYQLFRGVSIRFHDADLAHANMKMLSNMTSIKNSKFLVFRPITASLANLRSKVWPVRQYSVPAVKVHWTADEDATVADPYESAAHKIRQEGVADTYSPHLMTQVNRLRDQGIVGRGVKVAVIDTGVSHSIWGLQCG